MKRAIVLAVAFVLAALLAWGVGRSGDTTGAAACAAVERRLQAGDVAGARRERQNAADRLPDRVAHYLDAVIALAEAKDDVALTAIEAAYTADAAAPHEWRIVSTLFAARVNGRRREAAWSAIESYLSAHPTDERALAVAAQYWVEVRQDDPDPDRATGYLDAIAALAARTVPDDDPTAVRPATIARLRATAASLRGRFASAIGAAEERLKVAPDDAAAWAQLGEACRQSQRLDRAAQSYREAIRRAPGHAVYMKQLVLLLFEGPGNDAEMDSLTSSLLATAPDSPELLILRARALVRDRRTDCTGEAIEIYRRLLQATLAPAQEAEVCRNLGVALYDWKQAGRPGDYLDEAHTLLKRYRDLGGEIDLRLEDVWERLEARARANGGPPK